MEWVETTGPTVQAAKESALEQLGVDESEAEFELVAEPKSALFGLRRSDARVRARIQPTAPRAKDTSKRRGRRPDRKDKIKSENKRTEKPAIGSSESADSQAQGTPRGEDQSKQASTRKRNRRNRGNQNRPISSHKDVAGTEGDTKMEEVALEEQVEVIEEFLKELFGQINLPADVSSEIDAEADLIKISVEGENLGHLIGLRGNVLHALQEVTRTVVHRQTGARNGKVILDISHYREKRRVALEKFSRDLAAEVREKQVERSLEPMHPADRKIVHDTINEIAGVETISAGEEPRRYVVIRPSAN